MLLKFVPFQGLLLAGRASRRARRDEPARLHRAAAERTRRDRAGGRQIRRADLSYPRHVFRVEPLEPRRTDGGRDRGHESRHLASRPKYDLRRGGTARPVCRRRVDTAVERKGAAGSRAGRWAAEAWRHAMALRHFRRGEASQVVRSDSDGIRRNLARLQGRALRPIPNPNAQNKKPPRNDSLGGFWLRVTNPLVREGN
jgi:hypothetical protein